MYVWVCVWERERVCWCVWVWVGACGWVRTGAGESCDSELVCISFNRSFIFLCGGNTDQKKALTFCRSHMKGMVWHLRGWCGGLIFKRARLLRASHVPVNLTATHVSVGSLKRAYSLTSTKQGPIWLRSTQSQLFQESILTSLCCVYAWNWSIRFNKPLNLKFENWWGLCATESEAAFVVSLLPRPESVPMVLQVKSLPMVMEVMESLPIVVEVKADRLAPVDAHTQRHNLCAGGAFVWRSGWYVYMNTALFERVLGRSTRRHFVGIDAREGGIAIMIHYLNTCIHALVMQKLDRCIDR